MGDLLDAFGPGTRYSMPEAKIAFANGVSEMVVVRTPPGRGQRASLDLVNDNGDKVVTLIARAEGAWGNRISVQATQVPTTDRTGVKYIDLALFLDGQLAEPPFNNLDLDEESPNYLFDRINFGSRLVVAVDPLFAAGLPVAQDKTALSDAGARAAFTALKAGATDLVRAEAKRAGRRGNAIAIRVSDAAAGLALQGAGNAPSVDIKARTPGPDGTNIRVSVVPSGADAVSLVITAPPAASRTIGPFASVKDLTDATKNDPDIVVDALGTVLPASLASTQLQARINIEVVSEGTETTRYSNLSDLAAVASINDPMVAFSVIGAATALPDPDPGEPLRGGRDKGPALMLTGDVGDQPLLELQPVAGGANLAVTITRAVSGADHATPVVNLTVLANGTEAERYTDLTMDPDDPQYLPAPLTGVVGAPPRARPDSCAAATASFPANMVRAGPADRRHLAARPTTTRTRSIASNRRGGRPRHRLGGQPARRRRRPRGAPRRRRALHEDGRRRAQPHRARIGHRRRDGDVATDPRPRRRRPQRLFHPRGTAPGDRGGAGRPARPPGLLPVADLQDDRQPRRARTAVTATPQLEQLVIGNVVAINERAASAIIVIKGVLTSGRQINVQRTANKAVRDVKAIADRYIGLLNNDGTRNALRQQVTAMFLQMERDGALVPSTDGRIPPSRSTSDSTPERLRQRHRAGRHRHPPRPVPSTTSTPRSS